MKKSVFFIMFYGCIFSLNSTAAVTYYHSSANGSVIATSDEAGRIQQVKIYSPYGDQISFGMGSDSSGFGYAGHVYDRDTSLHYMIGRYYSSELGIFLSMDPKPVSADDTYSFNRYMYVDNDPINKIDPNGEDGFSIGLTRAITGLGGLSVAVDARFPGFSYEPFDLQLNVSVAPGGIVSGILSYFDPTNPFVEADHGFMMAKSTTDFTYSWNTSTSSGADLQTSISAGAFGHGVSASFDGMWSGSSNPYPSSLTYSNGFQWGFSSGLEANFVTSGSEVISIGQDLWSDLY